MDFMVVFDIVIGVLGIYLIYIAAQMKKKGEISNVLVNPEEITKCRDKKGFIDYIYNRVMIFGAVSMIFGVLGGINDCLYSFGKFYEVASATVYVLSWLWFTYQFRKGKEQYFR